MSMLELFNRFNRDENSMMWKFRDTVNQVNSRILTKTYFEISPFSYNKIVMLSGKESGQKKFKSGLINDPGFIYNLIQSGDVHLGSKSFHKDNVEQTFRVVNNLKRLFINSVDVYDTIELNHKFIVTKHNPQQFRVNSTGNYGISDYEFSEIVEMFYNHHVPVSFNPENKFFKLRDHLLYFVDNDKKDFRFVLTV